MTGRLAQTLERCKVSQSDQQRLEKALAMASARVSLPPGVIGVSPTLSAIRQQRLARYLSAEIKGGGIKRLEELLPRHPRDNDAWKSLGEIFRVCHEQILSLIAPRLHLRMAAISLKWMRGDPLPEIIDADYKYNGGALSSSIRKTLNDIEQEVRFKYFRLTSCYVAVLTHVLDISGYPQYVPGLSALPAYLEIGASDPTMVSLIGLGMSRLTARILTDATIEKEMDQAAALLWLRTQDINALIASSVVREDIQRAIANASPT
jgi:hypothetical protein